ncbi:Indigoidine synthase A like protein-domain-containing protein [Phakopsora pachyrhizi]|nr:Indigoidine synthase A like protein-domain-containing protein [Phakopsora pachyrhizi]
MTVVAQRNVSRSLEFLNLSRKPLTRTFNLQSHQSTTQSRFKPIDIHPEVLEALRNKKPVLALETAIVTHGLPYPTSVSLPLELERIARQHQVVPAHIALIKGRVKVGLSASDLEFLADPNHRALKLGRRDLPAALVMRQTGGTTVSATMSIASLAGIKVFATGGIGGVHRGGQDTLDISSDLTELGRNPVAVVCAGAKSILDIGLTLEYLETAGVPVVSLGDTKDFPAFYSSKSGYQAPFNARSVGECAEIIYQSDILKLQSGILVGVPIPDANSQDCKQIQDAVDRAIVESEELAINKQGKLVTPWLLNRVKELSSGTSVKANIALIKNNVEKAAQISACYSELTQEAENFKSKPISPVKTSISPSCPKTTSSSRVMIIGAAAVDITSQAFPGLSLQDFSGSTGAGTVKFSAGGVALNVARALFKLGIEDALLVSQLGEDSLITEILQREFKAMGLRTDGLFVDQSGKTGVVNMFLDSKGDLIGGIADLNSIEKMKEEKLSGLIQEKNPSWVCFDANLSKDAIKSIFDACLSKSISTAFEPTSITKCTKLLPILARFFDSSGKTFPPPLSLMFPNFSELKAIYQASRLETAPLQLSSLEWFRRIEEFRVDEKFRSLLKKKLPGWVTHLGLVQMAISLLPVVNTIVVKSGQEGLVVIGRTKILDQVPNPKGWLVSNGGLMIKHFPAPQSVACLEAKDGTISNSTQVNVTGAGDTLCGAILASIINGSKIDNPLDWDNMIDYSQQ